MNIRSRFLWGAGLSVLSIGACWNQSTFAQNNAAKENRKPDAKVEAVGDVDSNADDNADVDSDQKVQALEQGPVHEAFAPVVSFRPEAGTIVQKAPPELIQETAPNQRPSGNDVAWIPGYWAWDADRDDYLWISGVWRTIPPGRQWVPGYWVEADGGNQWISGYWASTDVSEVSYLPPPPAPVQEDVGDAPGPDQVWVPGAWVWSDSQYAWRPGYWITGNANWTWVPDYYVWSPRGFVSVAGYWDYVPVRRGILFAPVYFNGGVASRYAYTPSFVVSLGVFGTSLFVNPTYGHYYYGNYYGSNFANAGFYPWFAFSAQNRYGYDPIFATQRWQHRDDAGWEKNLQARADQPRDGARARGQTREGQPRRGNAGTGTGDGATVVALDKLAGNKDFADVKLQSVDKQEQQTLSQSSSKVRDFAQERQKTEAAAEGKAGDNEGSTAKAPRSPIAGKAAEGGSSKDGPPESPKVPETDPKVSPKDHQDAAPKATGSRSQAPRGDQPKGTARPAPDADDSEETPRPEKKPAPGTKPAPKPGTQPETKPEGKPAPKPESKPEGKPEPKPAPKPEGKPEPKPAPPKPEGKPEPKPAPKPESKPEPKPAPKPEAKPEPKPQPKPAPKPEGKPEPKPQPKA